jgi:hypothetical protein
MHQTETSLKYNCQNSSGFKNLKIAIGKMKTIIDYALITSVALYLAIRAFMYFVDEPHLLSYFLTIPLLGAVLFISKEGIKVRWAKLLIACGIVAIALSLSFYIFGLYKEILFLSPWFEFFFPVLPFTLMALIIQIEKINPRNVLGKLSSTRISDFSFIPLLGLVGVTVGKIVTYLLESWSINNIFTGFSERVLDILLLIMLGGEGYFGAGSLSFFVFITVMFIARIFAVKAKDS